MQKKKENKQAPNWSSNITVWICAHFHMAKQLTTSQQVYCHVSFIGSCRKSDFQNVVLCCFVLTNRRRLYVSLSQDADFTFVMRSLLLQFFISHCYLIQRFLEILLWNYKTFSLSSSLCNFRQYKKKWTQMPLCSTNSASPLNAPMLLQKV